MLYNQMQTSFIQQGMQMKSPSWLTVDQLNIVNALCIIICIPLFDSVVFPGLRRLGLRLGLITRMAIGFVISAAALFYAGIRSWQAPVSTCLTRGRRYTMADRPGRRVHRREVHRPRPRLGSHIGVQPDPRLRSHWSAFARSPKHVLTIVTAISEIFSSVTALEFAYSQGNTSCCRVPATIDRLRQRQSR